MNEPFEIERQTNKIRSMAWAFWQVLGCFFGIHGPARIMNWFWDVAHGEDREVSELFPITPEERAKYEWKHWFPIENAPKTGMHILVADFSDDIGFGGDPAQSYQCVVHWWQWSDNTHQEEWGWYPSTGAGDMESLKVLTHWRPLEELETRAALPGSLPSPAPQPDDLVERISRAICKIEGLDADEQSSPMDGPNWARYADAIHQVLLASPSLPISGPRHEEKK